MRTRDAFRIAFEHLSEHKLRTGLTMLGMMFGVGAVISMLAIGAGAEQRALQMIERLGVRNLVVRAKEFKDDELQELRKKSQGLSARDVRAIEEALPDAEIVAPRVTIEPYKVSAAGIKSEAIVHGVSRDQVLIAGLVLDEGRFFDRRDEDWHAQVAVIGAGVSRDLYGAEQAIGKRVKVNDVWLTVVGVLGPDSFGGASVQGVSLGTTDQLIYVPFTTALRKFEREALKSPLDEITVRLSGRASPQEVAPVLESLLDRLHGGAADFELIVPETLLEQGRKTRQLFSLVMGLIAGISLLVGGIGIMNIMLASVLEQTREIGVRRAVGAQRRDIRMQFLVSSFTLSILGGLAGVALGVGIAEVVAAYAGWPTVVTPAAVFLATGVSAVVGLASGLYPALRAANLDPIEALRYE